MYRVQFDDEWGQLQSVDAARYTYDFAGRRVCKTLGQQTTYFLYDGDNLIAELDQTGTPTRFYTWGETGLLSDAAPVGPGWQSRFYLFDAQGNTRTLVSETGVSLGEWAYTAWGSVYRNTPGVVLAFGWQGQSGAYTDAESGLVQRGFRYYAPCLGRFVSRDPIGYAGGLNLYAYCADDPINFTDPMGLQGPGADDGDITGMSDYQLTHAFKTVHPQALPQINRHARMAGAALKVAAEANPVSGLLELGSGKEASSVNKKLSKGERALAGIGIFAFLFPGEIFAEAKPSIRGFATFDQLKGFLGEAEPGYAWHHIVEQNASNIKTFGARAIHCPYNVVQINNATGHLHKLINGLYSSKNYRITGSRTLTVRQWLKTQSYEKQRQFGIWAILYCGGKIR